MVEIEQSYEMEIDVDPQTYIANVTAKIADDWPASRWDELMPRNCQADTDQDIAQAA